MNAVSLEERRKTMAMRAMRRLSDTEMTGLSQALVTLEELEIQLVEQLGDMRRAAAKEQRIRRELGLPEEGHYGRAYLAAHRLLKHLTEARIETGATVDSGRIPRKMRARA